MKKIKAFSSLLLAALLAFTPAAFSAFDPVNDDTDIFLANPNITAERPNVLIVLDNTANWNLPFTNEKSALVTVVNSLDQNFNVGLMMMAETGSPNDNVDGGYVRFHVRQMIDQNKTNLASLVNNLDILGDKGNNNTAGLALYEAYLYYGGKATVASGGKVKTDHDLTTDALLKPLTGHALPGTAGPPAKPVPNSLYRSPIANGCARNFIIYISNGAVNENAAARAFIEDKLATLTGRTPPATIAITPNGQQGNWGDEMARFMANADVLATNSDVPNSSGVQNVFTYAVEVNPQTTGQGPDTTALFKSVASNGKGKYFGVTDSAGGAEIINALQQIFTEIQAVNSVFAATTLPVSVNVRGTNLNQVYIGVFRPDANKAPRWLGNLKLYDLALSGNNVILADATNGIPPAVGNPAENAATGFISGNASSFWTADSTFWGFRDSSQNGVGGASDKPDGDLVEKGGAAQQIRIAYPNAETPQGTETLRKLYTCTTGTVNGVNQNCISTSSLKDTPFSTANAAIDATALSLSSRQVSPLTAFATKAVTALTDRRPVVLSNAGFADAVSSLSNGATTRTITSLKTSTPKMLTSLTALAAGSQSAALVSSPANSAITRSGSTCTATASANLPSQFVTNATVTFSGVTGSNQNNLSPVAITLTGAKTFTFGCSGNASGTGGTATISAFPSTTAVATLTGHGYTSGQTITISGATPTQFNGQFGITVTDSSHFNYVISSAAAAASGTITASGNTTTATAVTSANHGLSTGNTANIFGATPAGYNGSFTVTTIDNTTFTYTVASALGDNTASPVYMTSGGSTTVTATTALPHTLVNGQSINIAGSDISGYNGSFTVASVPSTTTFRFTTSSVLPANNSTTVTVSTSTVATVTATLTNHGFSAGNSVVIASTSGDTVHPGTFTILTVPTANTFTYSTGAALAPPTGGYTARSATSPKAFVFLPGHGYATNDQVKIAGASPTAYNGTFTITVVDADNFTYPLATAPGPNTSTAVTASVKSTTATATSVAHGFADQSSVVIAGATPTAFNGTFTITVVSADTFTYTIASAQGDATGAVTAQQAGSGGGDRDNVIKWVRGEDNFADENASGSTTDIRASVHGDVLHSRPAVINYNRFGSDNDVYIFYGANDGVFHAVKGGFASDAADPAGLLPGREAWGFIPSEFFDQLKRLRTDSPIISSSFKKPYFMDGSIGVLTKDAPILPGFPNGNGKLGDSGDIVNLYIAMRRGGRFIYALDVNNPIDPKLLWKIDSNTTNFGELGETWSQPTVVAEGFNGYPKPVVIFGAGYDAAVEDIDPATITEFRAEGVKTATGTFNRAMGRGIYVVDAITGALVWSAGKFTGATTSVSDMHFAIPSDVTVIKNASGLATNRAYVGDTGGNVWRIDFKSSNPSDATVVNLNGTTVTKIGSIANHSTLPGGLRKFLHAPDVVAEVGFDAVLLGSGDREHPFDSGVLNRFYMFKDKGTDTGPVTGATTCDPTITEAPIPNASCTPDPIAGMSDLTSNCIQDVTGCTGTETQSGVTAKLGADRGWFITLGFHLDDRGNLVFTPGEKVVGNAVSIAGTTFFNTNQPDTSAGGGTCGSNLGIARQYVVSTTDATATTDLNSVGGLTGADRSLIAAGGGYLPSPVHVVVMLEGKPVEAVISGVQVTTPTSATLQARLRKYWYKEIDQ